MTVSPVMYSSASDKHNTPQWLVEAITDFMGYIDLDPCTTPSNPCRASRFYTEADDAFTQSWEADTLYMNPPYGRGIGKWTSRFRFSHLVGAVNEAMSLLPARPDTQWWLTVADLPVCFPTGRLKFNDGKGGAPFPSALVYLGEREQEFLKFFYDLGPCYSPVKGRGI
jgi:hypothetical protein